MASNQAVTLFISYAHRDEELKSQLDKHLTPLKLQRVIDKWSDRHIEGGQDWAHQIDSNLKSADIILLLVSPDFVSSDYCAGIELKAAMKRYHDGEAIVVPVILEPCDWKWLEFGKLQATPKDGKAITDWANVNSAFLDVTNTIRQIAQGLLEKRQKKLEERQAASERYKAKVEEVLSDGSITPLERKTLNELRDRLGLTPEEAEAIKDSAYQPLREYQGKLAQYRVDLVETIQHEYPLSERTKVDLKQRQRELGLKAEDADRLDAEVLAGAEASYQVQLKSGEVASQRARAQAEQAARDAADGRAREEADRRAREAEEPSRKAALQAQRESELAAQRQAAEAAQRVTEAADRRRADEAQRQRAAVQDAAAPLPAAPPVAADPAMKPLLSTPLDSVLAGVPSPGPVTRRDRLLAAGVGAAIGGALVILSELLGFDSVDAGLFMVVAAIGAIAGAISATYLWIAVAAALFLLVAIASGDSEWLGVFTLGMIPAAVIIAVHRRLRAKKSKPSNA